MTDKIPTYKDHTLFFGDIHNHCGISYGHGPLEDAICNARLQLDFTSITGHAFWPDIPDGKGRLEAVVDYHKNGFEKLEKGWTDYADAIEKHNAPGKFITFPSYEMHSIAHGDYVVYCRDRIDPMIKPQSFEELQEFIRLQNDTGRKCFIVPHHIGYARGYRGINWETFSEEVSPLVEILSMHGCAESDQAPGSYLHTMGPRNGKSTMQEGLESGHHFGIIGSTDHHSAHPGSYGYGAAAIWAKELTRESLWEAMEQGRTYAITGDRIRLEYSVNGCPMGSVLPYSAKRTHKIGIIGSDSLDCIEILRNNTVIKRFDYTEKVEHPRTGPLKGKIKVEAGWGEKGIRQDWDITAEVVNGRILSSEPQFHGIDVVDPEDSHEGIYQFSTIIQNDERAFRFTSSTWGNSTSTTNSNQAVVLEVEGNQNARLELTVNGQIHSIPFRELAESSQSHYLGGFLTGAFHVSRLIPEEEYSVDLSFTDTVTSEKEDSYYIRIRQRNNQWAWSSPIWVKEEDIHEE